MTAITDLFKPRQGGTVLADQIDASGGCWVWTGSYNNWGYGKARHNNVYAVAHRVIWMCLVGEIPEGLELDHLCRNRGCVNPDHLEPVTISENRRRRPNTVIGRPYCNNGHLFTEANTRVDKAGLRNCRACAAKRAKDAYWKDPEKFRKRALDYQRSKRAES